MKIAFDTLTNLALHIAALECPKKSLQEIVSILLLAGSDPKIIDEEEMTALQLAKETNNHDYVNIFQQYVDFRKGILPPEESDYFRNLWQQLKAKYVIHLPKTDTLTVPKEIIEPSAWDDTQSMKSMKSKTSQKTIKSTTSHGSTSNASKHSNSTTSTAPTKTLQKPSEPPLFVPTFIAELINTDNAHNAHRIPADRPKDLLIPEEYIAPMSEVGFYQMKGLQSIKTLAFMNNQAQKNCTRREKLISLVEAQTMASSSSPMNNKPNNNNNNNNSNATMMTSLPAIHKK